jgi:hypothetical protein
MVIRWVRVRRAVLRAARLLAAFWGVVSGCLGVVGVWSLELGAYLCHCGGVERWMDVDIEVDLE